MNIQYKVASLDDTFSPTGDQVATISDLGSVIDISWQEGSDYITITTDSTVWPTHAVSATTMYCLPQVFLYPLETCSTATTCDECVASFPLCGWCIVENKCSRVSQCLDSSQTGRWVQESDQCITTTVTPDQFTQDAPTIVSV